MNFGRHHGSARARARGTMLATVTNKEGSPLALSPRYASAF
jgi:hypothetical protein